MHQSRSLDWVIAACSVALLAPLLGPLLAGRVFVYDDLLWFHLPMRYLYQQTLLAGDSVLWTPSIFAGVYLHGEGQVGLFHPLHQALYHRRGGCRSTAAASRSGALTGRSSFSWPRTG